jgi:methyl-accepting chemotaxis protein
VTPERALHYRARIGLGKFAFKIALFNLTAVLVPTGAALAVINYSDIRPWLACGLALGLASVMGMLFFLWFKLRVITPLQQVSDAAQMLIDNADQPNLISATHASLVQDLASSLIRLQERLQRLALHDTAEAQIDKQVGQLKAVFTQAAGGNLSLRAEAQPGPYQELALAANHMLDALAQRWLLQNRFAERVRLAGMSLHTLATELRGFYKPPPESVLGPLPEMFRVGVERLAVSADALGRVLEPTLSNKFVSGKQERFSRALSSTSTGLTFLAQRATDLARSAKRIADAHRQAEALAANLLLLADEKPHPQVRRVVDRAAALERDLAECETHISHGIEYLLGSREQLTTSLQELVALSGELAERVRTWESVCDQLVSIREELRQQIDLTRPVGVSIADHLQQLASELSNIRKDNSQSQQQLGELCSQTEQLSQLSGELLVLLERNETACISQPPPAPHKNEPSPSPAVRAAQELIQRAQTEGIIPINSSSIHSEFGEGYDIEVSEPEDSLAQDGKPAPEVHR